MLNDSDINQFVDFEKKIRNRINNKSNDIHFWGGVLLKLSIRLKDENLEITIMESDQWILDFINLTFPRSEN